MTSELQKILENSTTLSASISGIEIAGMNLPYEKEVSGDYIRTIKYAEEFDFNRIIEYSKKRNTPERHTYLCKKLEDTRDKIGIFFADFQGHGEPAAVRAGLFNAAVEIIVPAELEWNGEITLKGINNISDYCYKTKINGAMIVAEINTQGTMRHYVKGHHIPLIFSYEHNRLEYIIDDSSFESGLMLGAAAPHTSIRIYPATADFENTGKVNNWKLNKKDLYIFYSDGFIDPIWEKEYFRHVEQILRKVKDQPASKITEILFEYRALQQGFNDDASIVVIKKT